MSVEAIDTPQSIPDADSCVQDSVNRRAFYLNSDGRNLFAWLHSLGIKEGLDHGVVICPPIGYEQLHAHRALRHLADELARRQLPTLRFDWHGTGDSPGHDLESGRLAAWMDDVRSAVHWLKAIRGCRRVSVVGLRMGATIAALSLQDEEIENLVLWAPVINGRAYVREMTVIDKTSDTRPTTGHDSSGVIDAAGFLLSRETANDLTKISLLGAKPRCHQILVSDRDDASVEQRLIDHFSSLNLPTDQQILPGVAQMLVEPHRSTLPETAIGKIASWIQDAATRMHPSDPLPACDPPENSLTKQAQLTRACSNGNNVHEELFPISASPNLFGILCRPATPIDEDRPLIVILNSGSACHIGPGRMTVEMAREFAAHGFSSLRFDLCGLGDSVTTSSVDENDSYVRTMFRDIEITLQQVKSRLGVRRCVLMGLCSGAYAAFQSAAQIKDETLIESVLINPLTFFWREGMTIDDAPSVEMIKEHYYLTSALQPGKWLKLLSGKSQIGIAGALRLLARRFGLMNAKASARTSRPKTRDGDFASHPDVQDLNADLKRIVARGRPLSLFFASNDPGYGILMRQSRWQASRMLRRGQLGLTFIDNADHTFSRRAARQELVQKLVAHLCKRYPTNSVG